MSEVSCSEVGAGVPTESGSIPAKAHRGSLSRRGC